MVRLDSRIATEAQILEGVFWETLRFNVLMEYLLLAFLCLSVDNFQIGPSPCPFRSLGPLSFLPATQ